MRVSFEDAQRAWDDLSPEDLEYQQKTDEERGEDSENQAYRRNE